MIEASRDVICVPASLAGTFAVAGRHSTRRHRHERDVTYRPKVQSPGAVFINDSKRLIESRSDRSDGTIRRSAVEVFAVFVRERPLYSWMFAPNRR